jgi:hypothetical protein
MDAMRYSRRLMGGTLLGAALGVGVFVLIRCANPPLPGGGQPTDFTRSNGSYGDLCRYRPLCGMFDPGRARRLPPKRTALAYWMHAELAAACFWEDPRAM